MLYFYYDIKNGNCYIDTALFGVISSDYVTDFLFDKLHQKKLTQERQAWYNLKR